jgi:WxL domain surface cell wall-binding
MLSVSILPGPLTVSPTSEPVTLTDLRAFGHSTPFYRGDLSPITVDDARGSLAGWRVTVSLQTVSGLDAAQLASTRLCVSPYPTTLVAGNPADNVRSSSRACAGPGDPIAVFSAAPGGGGGEYSDTAGIALTLPDGASAPGTTASFVVSVR